MTTKTEKAKFTWTSEGPRASGGRVDGRRYTWPWPDARVTWHAKGGKRGWKIHFYWPGGKHDEIGLPPDEIVEGTRKAECRKAARMRAQELLTMLEPGILELHEKIREEARQVQAKRDADAAEWDRQQALKKDMLEALNRRYPELEIVPSNIPLKGPLEVVDLGRLTKLLSRLDPA